MMKKTGIALFCAGALTAGSIFGLTGFASQDNTEQEGKVGTYSLVSTSNVDEALVEEEGTATVEEVAAAVMPAVVSITNRSVTEVQDIFSRLYGGRGGTYEYENESAGSGIIIGENDSELLICTNYHVIENADEITVGFVDDSIYSAELKGGDQSNDLAVVAVNLDDLSDDTLSQIKIAQIGTSDDLAIGQQVVAIGNALGYGQSVTTGIISALNRTIQLDTYTAEMIQTDAAINPGNSGGALLDMNGRVIGINSAKAAETGVEGMGYAIPISSAEPILEDLMNRETRTEVVDESESAFIGISGEAVSEEMASLYGIPEGIYVTEVSGGSPAEDAGIQRGDVITKFEGSSVTNMNQLRDQLQYYAAGETVTITISQAHDGVYEEQDIEVTLGALADYQNIN
ncbi:MAG TPA: trypsin-like peptidase domain-containing protein [Candidatus Choladousia intestinigallinarum]|nr:trypsin-like peptidase domain-containing protein [Candidatus Choladousia intestinigallinarum]